jgi:beta-glucosidase
MKTLWQYKQSRVWVIVTAIVLVFAIVANYLVTIGPFYSIVCLVLGSKRAEYADGQEAIYATTTSSKEEAKEQGADLTRTVAEEGIVLLKNDDGALPLAEGAKISVFGKNSVNIVFGGSGSGGGDSSESKTLYESLELAGFDCNPTLKAFYEDDSKSGSPRDSNPKIENNGNSSIVATETPYDSLVSNQIPDSYSEYSDAALIVFSRIGGEGFDLPRTSSDDADRHYLELAPNEQELVRQVCAAGFQKVIVIINSANVMELGFVEDDSLGHIDACLNLPGPGSTGALALGDILKGAVNPSGHTVDTFPTDLTKDPVWNNFGDNNTEDGDKYTDYNAYFVDYEEGVYVGYRYYETRGYTDGEEWYEDSVVYPFGYGLSYTTFEWSVDDSDLRGKEIESDKDYAVTVTVTNTGDVAGKDVVQLYASAPYYTGEIEKPHKVLVGFVKTDLLQPGESGTYTLEVTPYDFASYDYSDANGNGFAGYELDGGDYTLYVSRNAHESVAEIPFTVEDDGIRYETDPDTGATVTNLFDDSDDHLVNGTLSRSDWEGTWPQPPTDEDRIIDDNTKSLIENTTTNNPNEYTEMPTTGASYDTVITLRDMNGVDYDDEKWDEFLDQLMPDEMVKIYNEAAFQTYDVHRLGIPYTKESDGPVGFCNFMSDKNIYGTNAYTCEVMLGQTWNVDLAQAMGESIAEEGKWGDSEGRVSGMPYSGLYGPGANIHRSAFGGRNFEYFSEDSFLTGMMAAYEIKGAQSEGIFMTMKHFALNEQETHRSTGYGSCSWVTEQSMREIYLKPFEMAVKIADNHAVMSSFNRIGTQWTGGDYRLLTQVLREEWGFDGLVICDFNTNSYMNTRQEAYAGGDLNLSENRFWNSFNSSSASDVTVIRNAMHNVMYTLANTNAVNGEIVGYSIPVWQYFLMAFDVLLVLGFGYWGWVVIRKAKAYQSGESQIRVCKG